MGEETQVLNDSCLDLLKVLSIVVVLYLGTHVRKEGEIRTEKFKVFCGSVCV